MVLSFKAITRGIAISVVALVSATVGTQTVFSQEPNQDALCNIEGSAAGIIMRARQMGLPLSTNLEISASAPGANREMVLEAYEQPKWSTLEIQNDAVMEFRNRWTLACLRR